MPVKSPKTDTGEVKTSRRSEVLRSRRAKCGGWITLVLLVAILSAAVFQIAYLQDPLSSSRHQQQHENQAFMDHSVWKLSHWKRNNQTLSKPSLLRQMNSSGVESTQFSAGLNTTTTSLHKSQTAPAERKNEQQSNNAILNNDNPLLKLLEDAGILNATQIEQSRRNNTTITADNTTTIHIANNLTLPSWSILQALYGPLEEPVIVGLDTCETYRNTVPLEQRYAAVAGMFNTGTNAFEYHLRTNLQLRHVWQVPWGKHRMPSVRDSHMAPGMEHANKTAVLPVVLIRDPFYWMQSMCKMPYAAHWNKPARHCPNLVPNEIDYQRWGAKEPHKYVNGSVPVKVIFSKTQIMYWDSLIDLYNDHYRQYLLATDYPRLMVRFEDMLLLPTQVLQRVADCAGTKVADVISYQTGSAKGHGSHTTFLKAIQKTGDPERRRAGMTPQDLAYAREHLDPELLQQFHYQVPELVASFYGIV